MVLGVPIFKHFRVLLKMIDKMTADLDKIVMFESFLCIILQKNICHFVYHLLKGKSLKIINKSRWHKLRSLQKVKSHSTKQIYMKNLLLYGKIMKK